jgi:formylglycine-generating enzyme required for sulfatase activity
MRFLACLMILAFFVLGLACSASDSGDDDAAGDAVTDDDNDDNNDNNDNDSTGDDDDNNDHDDDDDTPDENGLTWVTIPAGSFAMGWSPGDYLAEADEYPRHDVTLSVFRMTATEITQQQYQTVAGVHENANEGCVDCPVEVVTWFEAEAYCEAVGGHLPTEAQWEYAARAGTTTKYYCGDDPECLAGIAWMYPNSGEISHRVGLKTPNVFGLYDMLGNVWEWVHDYYGAAYYRKSPDQDPVGPATGMYRILRGASFYDSDPAYLRVSFRPNDEPEIAYGNIGFRCAAQRVK